MMRKWLSYKDVAERFGLCVRTIRRMVDGGELPQPVAVRGRRLFIPEEVEAAERKLRGRRRR